ALSLVMQFGLGLGATVAHQVYSALLVDVFPDRPGTAGAANNMCRCALAMIGVAVMQRLVERIRRGWFFTGLGVVHGLGSAMGVWVLRRKCPEWRKEKIRKIEAGSGKGFMG
ncbi:hypothetical protein BR93DRAFT_884453, partial [Coniochaeta sp. PMI_546]